MSKFTEEYMRYASEFDTLRNVVEDALGKVIDDNEEKHGKFGFLKHSSAFHIRKAAGHLRKHIVCKAEHEMPDEDHLAHALTRIAMAIFCEDVEE